MTKKLKMARRFIITGVMAAFLIVGVASMNAQLRDGLVAHWPLDEIDGETTPDLVSGYDMNVTNLDEDSVVTGKYGNAISFSNAEQTLLWRKNEEGDALPANQHDSFTISFWSKVDGTGQNDLRLFSESNTEGNNTPLFNIGTKNNGSDGTIDIYIRGAGPTVGHIFSTAEPFDDEWHHVVFVQDELERSIYVDGELDDLEIAAKPDSGWDDINATTIGGILRGNASHWVTGLIDDVAIWTRALSADDISELTGSGIPAAGGGGSTLTNGLTGYWPLEAGDGTTAANTAGGEDAELHNGVEWVDDPDRGTVLSFDGVDGYADAGAETIPQMTQDNDFTWSVWINQGAGNGPNNVVLGNRYSPGGGDFAPREFIKLSLIHI